MKKKLKIIYTYILAGLLLFGLLFPISAFAQKPTQQHGNILTIEKVDPEGNRLKGVYFSITEADTGDQIGSDYTNRYGQVSFNIGGETIDSENLLVHEVNNLSGYDVDETLTLKAFIEKHGVTNTEQTLEDYTIYRVVIRNERKDSVTVCPDSIKISNRDDVLNYICYDSIPSHISKETISIDLPEIYELVGDIVLTIEDKEVEIFEREDSGNKITISIDNPESGRLYVSLNVKVRDDITDQYIVSQYEIVDRIPCEGVAVKWPEVEFRTTNEITITPPPQPLGGTVKISKVDEDDAPLPGATLQIQDSNGSVVEEFITNEDTSSYSLDAGDYQLVEVNPPKGFKIAAPISFTIKPDETTTVTMVDEKEEEQASKPEEPTSTSTGSVVVKYITEDGKQLYPTDSEWEIVLKDQPEGTDYNSEHKIFDDYEFVKVDTENHGNSEGKIVADTTIEVVYVYKKVVQPETELVDEPESESTETPTVKPTETEPETETEEPTETPTADSPSDGPTSEETKNHEQTTEEPSSDNFTDEEPSTNKTSDINTEQPRENQSEQALDGDDSKIQHEQTTIEQAKEEINIPKEFTEKNNISNSGDEDSIKENKENESTLNKAESTKQITKQKTNKDAPKTGDRNNMALWSILALIGFSGAASIAIFKKRKSGV